MSPQSLRQKVTQLYDELDLATWPNPHADRDALEEEYSRVTNPGRLTIVIQRARVWQRVLEAELLATATEIPGASTETFREPSQRSSDCERMEGGSGTYDFALRLRPKADGALDLYFLANVGDGDQLTPSITLAIASPGRAIDYPIPDCGCDACDLGSQDLLEALDSSVLSVLSGIVLLRSDRFQAAWSRDGLASLGESGPGRLDFDHVMAQCERLSFAKPVELPAGTEVTVSAPWF